MTPWIGAMALLGCDDVLFEPREVCPPLHVLEGAACAFEESAVPELMRTFRDEIEPVNAVPFEQVFPIPILRNVWASALPLGDGRTTADLYRTIDPHQPTVLDGAFPTGTVLVHEAVEGGEGNTVQIRLGDEYDDGFGRQWFFGKYFEDGTPDEIPCSPCTDCHRLDMRAGSDGLWGVPREAL